MSVYCTNRYVFYALPFLITRIGKYVGWIFDDSFYRPVMYSSSLGGDLVVCLLRNIMAYAVLGFCFYREISWRMING